MSANPNNRDDVAPPSQANATPPTNVGHVPSRGLPSESPPRRLRRLHRVWPDRDGNISYLLTACVEDRERVLDNELILERLVSFLLDSPDRYHWFGRRFVIMPDHIHLIAHQGADAVRLGQWMKALKAVVGGSKRRGARLQTDIVGRVPAHGELAATHVPMPADGAPSHEFTRVKRSWRWQSGFHDHKFRTPESEQRKWEYVCLNPVRAGLVMRPEEWPFGGEVFCDEDGGPRWVRGAPPLLETGLLIEGTPVEGNRPTT